MTSYSSHSFNDDVWIEQQLDRFEQAWRTQQRPEIEAFISGERPDLRAALIIELIKLDSAYRHRLGEDPELEIYLARFPDLQAVPAVELNQIACELQFGGDQDKSRESRSTGGNETSAESITEDANLFSDSQRFRSRFKLRGRIGEGGFGVVYRAFDVELNRDVAVKMPRLGAFSSDSGRARFLREARTASMLRHPGIVKIHDIFTDEKTPFIVSEFVDGQTLDQVLNSGRLPYRQSAELVAKIAGALECGHRHGVVHRDIKPKNIMVTAGGDPVVLDFGIAHMDREETLTAEGEVLGTPAYMSPERVLTEHSLVDPTTDVYSLAVVLYVLLAGELPFRGSTARIVHQIIHEEPLPPRYYRDDIPKDLQTICLKGMNKTSSRRYQSAGEMAADLQRYLEGRPVLARPVTRAEKGWRWCRRNPLIAALATIASISLLALAMGGFVAASVTSNLAQSEKASRNKEQIRLSRGLAESGVLKLRQGDLRGMADLVRSFEPARNDSPELESRLTVADHWSRSHAGRLAQVFGMDSPIRHATLSPNGNYAATLDIGGTMRVWDCETGLPLTPARKWQVNSGELWRLQFTPDEKRLIPILQSGTRLGTWDWRTNRIWDLETNLTLLNISPKSVFVATDSRHILFLAAADNAQPASVFEWNVESNRIEARFVTKAIDPNCVAFDPTGEMFGFGNSEGIVTVCHVGSGSLLFSQSGHGKSVQRLVFSSDKRWLASSSIDRTVRIWSLADKGQAGPPLRHDEDVKDMAFSPDGSLLATASFDGSVRVWRTDDSTRACSDLVNHAPVLSIAFNHDGSLLATGGFDSQVRLWSMPEGRPIDNPILSVGTVRQLDFRQGTNQLLVFGATKVVQLWQIVSGQAPKQIVPQTDRVWSVDFSSDGQWLTTASQDGRATVWSIDQGKPVFEPPVRDGEWEVLCTRLHPDQRRLLTLSKGSFYVQDLYAPGNPPFKSENKNFRFAQFSADGHYAVLGSGGADGVFLFDFSDFKYPFTQMSPPTEVGAVAIDPTGTRCAAACPDKSVWIWKVADHSLIKHIVDAHSDIVDAITFSPDGQTVATASSDVSIRLWNASDGSAREPVMTQQAPVQGLAFSPNGKLLAAAGSDRRVQLWDTTSGLPCGEPFLHDGFATSVAFSPDGRLLASGSFDKSARLWDLPPPVTTQQESEIRKRIWVALGMELDPNDVLMPVPWQRWQQWRNEVREGK